MTEIFSAIFYQPILNLLIVIYNVIPGHDMGVAIIALTILVKIILAPLSWKQLESQKMLQDIQPKLNEIKEQYKNDKEGLARAQMQYFQEQKINPLSSCLPLLVQLPFLFAMYYVFMSGLKNDGVAELLYPFVQNPGKLNETFFGVISMTQNGNIVLAVAAAGVQYWQAKMITPKKRPPKVAGAKDEDMAAAMSQNMLLFMPVITGVMTYQFPAGLGLYWFFQTAVAIVQQYVFNMRAKNKPPHVEVIPAKR
ncbi:membrane protein insertase YidC [Candidatus Uhrbacteria bacterium]|nr:membrane protein insertase YidC [Candidatus Uhrbacteria bacterium]